MTTHATTGPCSAYSDLSLSADATAEIVRQLGVARTAAPRCIVFFAALSHDGAIIGQTLQASFPAAHIIGCSSNGEFTDGHFGKGGVAALALYDDTVGALASTQLALDAGIRQGASAAAERLGQQLGVPLRELDPQRYVGIALLEGAKGREEQINEALGDVAPLLSFVGGSAGDNISFSGTWVFAAGRQEKDACALLVVELLRPFAILKTCNFVPTPTELTVTRADPSRRLILEIDGKPAAQRYAELIGAKAEELAFSHFLENPLGLMIDGEAWLRSGVRTDGNALFFACAVLEGMTLHLMQATDIVEDTKHAFVRAAQQLGAPLRAAVLFNCAYRMLEVQLKGVQESYHQALSALTHAGLHSNGESYLGHINQTLTGLVIA
jgi:hypothetical protein